MYCALRALKFLFEEDSLLILPTLGGVTAVTQQFKKCTVMAKLHNTFKEAKGNCQGQFKAKEEQA